MEPNLNVAAGVVRLTVNLDEDDVTLFQNTWPVAHGVALHAYLVTGARRLVVDPWDAGGYGPEEVEADLTDLGLKWSDIEFVAFTQAPAPDLLARLRAFHPGLKDAGLPAPGARIDLGAGVTLEARDGFWVVEPAGAALTGDAFAGLGWVDETVWAEDAPADEARFFEDEALRFYAQRPHPASLPAWVRVVAPAHGLLFRNPEKAVARAGEFEAWGRGLALDEAAVVWPAGDEAGAEALVGGALDAGFGLSLFRLPGDEATALAAGVRRASLVVLAEGLDDACLRGLTKAVWRPALGTDPAVLRQELARRWQAL